LNAYPQFHVCLYNFAGGDATEKEQWRGQQQKELIKLLKRYIILYNQRYIHRESENLIQVI